MTDTPLSATPLAEINGSYANRDILAGEMSLRLKNGRAQEVVDFLRECDESVLNQLGYASGELAWETDAATWLALAQLTVPRGVLLREGRGAGRQRNDTFSRELCELAEQYLAGTGAQKDALIFVMRNIIDRLAYPGIPRQRVFNLLEWNLALSRAAGWTDDQGYNIVSDLVQTLDHTVDLIALSGTAERYFETALHVFKCRARAGDLRTRWLPWHDFFQQYPEYIDRHHSALGDPGLILRRWEGAAPKLRGDMLASLMQMMRWYDGADQAYVAETIDQLVRIDEAFLGIALRERPYNVNLATATLIWQRQYPGLVPVLLPLMTGSRDSVGQYRELVLEILSSRPDLMQSAVAANLDQLIPLLGADLLRTLLPDVGTLIGKSASKSLRDAIAEAGKTLAIADIVQAGWLNVRNKNLRLACKDLLIAHPDQASASPLLAAMLAAGQLDAATASSVEAHLAQGTPSAEPQTGAAALARLETQAAGIKRWSAAIKPLDTAETLALFQPLSEHAARAALHLAATAEDGLPPLAGALLAQLPVEARARLALHLVQLWIGSEGNPKLRFVLQLAVKGADDRIVDLLSETVFSWAKTRKQRAVIAVEQLAGVDSLYALARVLEISESKKVRGMIPEAALDALKAAAARRKLALAELLDELTPDFGLGQGISLTVGEASYRVVLQGDLSLRLVDAKGKVSKTLPANKDDATREAWDMASSQFKTVSASLKAVAKLQAPRMLAALVTAKTWSAPRWTQLFLDHAVLRIMGRSLIWQIRGAHPRSFRIAEDFSLLQANDDVLTLPPDAQLSLWHPATALAGEAEAWRSNFADYEIVALIDQIGAPAALPPEASMSVEHVLAPAGLSVVQEQLAATLTRCGYRKGPVNDGPSIDWHEWHLPAAQLAVHLENGYCSPMMELGKPIEVHGIRIWNTDTGASVPPASLPVPLLATVWSHLQLLDAKRNQ
ncbi:DUF4132 domain-containing protein [Massilia rubra]|nr:DUF4132 domain-containing protein [Massilia rubra]